MSRHFMKDKNARLCEHSGRWDCVDPPTEHTALGVGAISMPSSPPSHGTSTAPDRDDRSQRSDTLEQTDKFADHLSQMQDKNFGYHEFLSQLMSHAESFRTEVRSPPDPRNLGYWFTERIRRPKDPEPGPAGVPSQASPVEPKASGNCDGHAGAETSAEVYGVLPETQPVLKIDLTENATPQHANTEAGESSPQDSDDSFLPVRNRATQKRRHSAVDQNIPAHTAHAPSPDTAYLEEPRKRRKLHRHPGYKPPSQGNEPTQLISILFSIHTSSPSQSVSSFYISVDTNSTKAVVRQAIAKRLRTLAREANWMNPKPTTPFEVIIANKPLHTLSVDGRLSDLIPAEEFKWPRRRDSVVGADAQVHGKVFVSTGN